VTRKDGVPELDCVDVREALFAGRALSPAEAAHAAACPVCSQSLPPEPLEPSPDLFAELNAAVGKEHGLVAAARSVSTPGRVAGGAFAAVALALGMALLRPRWGFGPVPVERVVSELAALVVVLGGLLALSLRPLQSAPPARRLGFVVHHLQPAFPDCEAMRETIRGHWQRLRIEFEFESRSFLKHRHKKNGCDIIVCWRHNWPECPASIEVLELSKELHKELHKDLHKT